MKRNNISRMTGTRKGKIYEGATVSKHNK